MEGLQCCDAARGCARDLPDIQFQKQATRISGLSVSEEQNSEITILTDEGDTVMLSSRQRSEAALLTYEHLSWTPHESLQEGMQLSAAESEGEVAFAVDGELNDQEMADIQALLKELGGMLKAFLTGEDESEASPLAAGELDRFETISAFKADFEYRVSTYYLNFEAGPLALRKPAEPEPAATAAPGAATSAAGTTPPAPTAAAVPAGKTVVPLDSPRGEAEQAADRMAKRVQESGLARRGRLKQLKKFLKNFLKQLLADRIIDLEQSQRGRSVIEKFINELQKPADAAEVRTSRMAFSLQYVSRAYEDTVPAEPEPAVVETA
jgi:hypothetical protein